MKKLLLLLSLVVLSIGVFAYEFDVILTKERKQISCFILSEDVNQVVYMLTDNDVHQYTMNKTDILKIYYADKEQKDNAAVVEDSAPIASSADRQEVEKDVIVLKNNTKIECNVEEVRSNEIKYRILSNPNSPIFIEETSNIVAIMFRDGSVRTYEQYTNPETMKQEEIASERPQTSAQSSSQLPKNAFLCNIELGAQFTSNKIDLGGGEYYKFPSGGVDFDMSFGVRSTKIAFLGAGLGIHSEFANVKIQNVNVDVTFVTMPIYVDSRLYIPTSVDVNPFLLCHLGGYVVLSAKGEISNQYGHSYEYTQKQGGGFYTQIGFGFEAKRFQMSIGYRMLARDGKIGNYGFVKMGVRIGKNVAPYKKP